MISENTGSVPDDIAESEMYIPKQDLPLGYYFNSPLPHFSPKKAVENNLVYI